MGEFNPDDHYIYYYGSSALNGVALIVNKRVWNAVPVCNFKSNSDLGSFQDKPFNITVIQSILQLLMPKKMKLNGFIMIYETFYK